MPKLLAIAAPALVAALAAPGGVLRSLAGAAVIAAVFGLVLAVYRRKGAGRRP